MTPADFYVLLSVSRGAAASRAIADDVLALTGGEFGVDLAEVVSSLRRLLADGRIEVADSPHPDQVDEGASVQYGITQAGREALVSESGRLARTLAAARKRLPEEL
jgi:hypothetical protein